MAGDRIILGLVIRLLPKCRDQDAKRGRAFDQFLRLGTELFMQKILEIPVLSWEFSGVSRFYRFW